MTQLVVKMARTLILTVCLTPQVNMPFQILWEDRFFTIDVNTLPCKWMFNYTSSRTEIVCVVVRILEFQFM